MSVVFDAEKCKGCAEFARCEKQGGPLIEAARARGLPEVDIEAMKKLSTDEATLAMLIVLSIPLPARVRA